MGEGAGEAAGGGVETTGWADGFVDVVAAGGGCELAGVGVVAGWRKSNTEITPSSPTIASPPFLKSCSASRGR